MYYIKSNFVPSNNIEAFLKAHCKWDAMDRNLGDRVARKELFSELGWPEELEADATILVGKLYPRQSMFIHKDTARQGYSLRSAFNIPVTKDVKFEWYRGKTPESDSRSPTATSFPILEEKEAEVVESYQDMNGFWTSINSWHRMVNTGPSLAWMISFRWPERTVLNIEEINPETDYYWIKN